MYEVHDDYYANLMKVGTNRRVRFLGGDVKMLREMTEEEWEKAKEKARRWQPTSR